MTLNISSQVHRIIIRLQLMCGSITLNSGEIVCTTKLGCPGDGLTLSEIVASPLRPHVGQTKAILAWLGIRAVWAGSPLRRCPNCAHGDVSLCLGTATLIIPRTCDSGGLPKEVFDGLQAQLAANRSQFYRDLPEGPFYGFNRPGVKASEAIIQNWWRQGMMAARRRITRASSPSHRPSDSLVGHTARSRPMSLCQVGVVCCGGFALGQFSAPKPSLSHPSPYSFIRRSVHEFGHKLAFCGECYEFL
jgi:hypothetical protein